jgi:spermidine synthase
MANTGALRVKITRRLERAVLAVALWLVASLAVAASGNTVVFSKPSPYHKVTVVDTTNGQRCMTFGRMEFRQSCVWLSGSKVMALPYSKMMMGALYLHPNPRRILFMGLGGGVIQRALKELYPKAHIDNVEIDPVVIEAAQKFFGVEASASFRLIESDARIFVRRAIKEGAAGAYDMVFLDTFNADYVPEHLLTLEYFQELKQIMTPDAVLIANTFSFSRLYDHESVTYQRVFGDFYNLRGANRVLIAEVGARMSREQIAANALVLAPALRPYGITADYLLPLFSRVPDWELNARPLTDQYAPTNLLGRPHWLTWSGIACLLGFNSNCWK